MKKVFGFLHVSILTVFSMTVSAENQQYIQRGIDPLVSTEWLAAHLNDPDLVIMDIRSAGEYSSRHIPKAINVSTEKWWITKDQLLLELPDPAI